MKILLLLQNKKKKRLQKQLPLETRARSMLRVLLLVDHIIDLFPLAVASLFVFSPLLSSFFFFVIDQLLKTGAAAAQIGKMIKWNKNFGLS